MRQVMAVTKALADAQRVRILLALRDQELCVCQIIELLGLAGSTVSKHLAILHQAELVESRKDERWVYYRLPDQETSDLVHDALHWIGRSAASSAIIKADQKRLRQVLRCDPRTLCQQQSRKST